MTTDDAQKLQSQLLEKLAPIGQQHLLAFWDQLGAQEQARLAEQIGGIDADIFRELKAEFQRCETA
ncbi:MAG: hypothetical protein JF612_01955, partial [Planctomycetia bacterium]|nr:hypothetical protein [Planctomycetia bacterium]